MKVCIFGAGALGSHAATRFLASGAAEVSIIARGKNLEEIRRHGFMLRSNDVEMRAKAQAITDDPARLPAQDFVVVALKAPALPGAASAIARLLGSSGTAIFLANGIPWWWRYGLPGKAEPLPLLDPDGALWREVGPQRTLGCVIYSPNELVAPGHVVHRGFNRWVLAEPDNSQSERLARAVELFKRSSFPAEASTDLRREIWLKLVRNASNNTISALIRQTLFAANEDPDVRRVAANLIYETLDVAAALGWDVRSEVDVEKFVAQKEAKGGPRTSMLQDVLLNRPIEVEVLLGQTQAFAREVGVTAPTIDVVVPLLRALDKSLTMARGAQR